jgi:hypothetical protein
MFKPETAIMLFLAFLAVGCGKNYEAFNTDPTRLTSLSPDDVKGLFPNTLYRGMYATEDAQGDYQYSQGMFADLYSQYFATSATFDQTDRYVIVQDWVQNQWYATYIAAMPGLLTILKETGKPESITLNAIARIWKVFVLHRTTDYFGPIPYSKIGLDSAAIAYDDQKDIYYDFFKQLSEAATDLQNNISKPSYGTQDVIFNGNNTRWLKFANTLRLRLALRISNVAPDKARQEAEAAITAGVMTDVSQDAYLSVSALNINGFNRQAGWNEFRMSTAMESVLKGYNDPRLPKYFKPALATGEYAGARNGMNPAEIALPQNDYDHTSDVSEYLAPDNMTTTPMTVMHSAEAYFLRAEAALNGWEADGTPQALYEKGIEMALKSWNITDPLQISNYINSTNVPMAPGGYFSTPAMTDIPVKFSTDPQKQREQIITQKWLCLYPDGHEAWAEARRTNYPKLYARLHSDNPDLSNDKMIRRIPFVNFDRDKNGPAVKEAEKLLKGPDNIATSLWWDVH